MEKRILYWLWLTTARGISNSDITALWERFDNIEEIYAAEDYGSVPGVRPYTKRLLKNKSLKTAERVVAEAEKTDMHILTFDDPCYPDSLRTIESPPYVLYLRGELMNWDRLLTIGIVGTRSCTEYGIRVTGKIAAGLAERGVTVAGGMARGIDSVAARAALDAGNKVVAVLGCGADIVYPQENAALMNRIIENGAVLTEYPPGYPVRANNFPWRNRIISGLARGILVTEAPKKSGALITANYALEQGRDVFAVPGSIEKPTCAGTNALLSKCAKAVTCAEDILEEYVYAIERLRIEKPKTVKAIFRRAKESVNNEIKLSLDEKRYAGLSEEERNIISLLMQSNMHTDDIARKCGIGAEKLTPMLSMLEFGGYIQRIPGNNYKLNIN